MSPCSSRSPLPRRRGGGTRRRPRAAQATDLALERVEGPGDRIATLTEVVGVFEAGLGALRVGLRQVAPRERTLEAGLSMRQAEIARLAAALAAMEQGAGPLMLLHPFGPFGTARASMLLAEAVAALPSCPAAELVGPSASAPRRGPSLAPRGRGRCGGHRAARLDAGGGVRGSGHEPAGGTPRDAGPPLGYSNVMIQEPLPELLAVFAGLAEV